MAALAPAISACRTLKSKVQFVCRPWERIMRAIHGRLATASSVVSPSRSFVVFTDPPPVVPARTNREVPLPGGCPSGCHMGAGILFTRGWQASSGSATTKRPDIPCMGMRGPKSAGISVKGSNVKLLVCSTTLQAEPETQPASRRKTRAGQGRQRWWPAGGCHATCGSRLSCLGLRGPSPMLPLLAACCAQAGAAPIVQNDQPTSGPRERHTGLRSMVDNDSRSA
mmetsp:Transcript_5115/g.14282  ORF Transcript_5115/g.14282 Transcript_5115/m.14282 type:complete len:225 (+) Transcript_5115:917-1591(+)